MQYLDSHLKQEFCFRISIQADYDSESQHKQILIWDNNRYKQILR